MSKKENSNHGVNIFQIDMNDLLKKMSWNESTENDCAGGGVINHVDRLSDENGSVQ